MPKFELLQKVIRDNCERYINEIDGDNLILTDQPDINLWDYHDPDSVPCVVETVPAVEVNTPT